MVRSYQTGSHLRLSLRPSGVSLEQNETLTEHKINMRDDIMGGMISMGWDKWTMATRNDLKG